MEPIPTKNTGDSYTASEFNESNDELKNSITDGGQTLTSADDFQISKSMAINAAGATFYVDSGVTDAYVLSKAGTVSLRSPVAYFEGMGIRFRPDNNNSGASTVNVTALGVKAVLKPDGVTALSPGDIATDRDAEARFDISADAFFLMPGISDATKTGKGLAFLGDQIITLANGAVDPDNDIDFSGGRFTFDDGSGEMVATALTKQLDSSFVVGNNQGGLDTGAVAGLATYHCFGIFNPATGVADYLFSLSATAPTLPSGFTKKRRIGSILTQGAPSNKEIFPFVQTDKKFTFKTRILDQLDTLLLNDTAETLTLSTPVGIEVLADMIATAFDNATTSFIFSALDEVDIAPIQNTADLTTPSDSGTVKTAIQVKTDTSSQIRGRVSVNTYSLFTLTLKSWIDFSLEG